MAEEDDDFLYRPQSGRGQRVDPAIQRMALAAGGVSLLVILIAWGWSGFHAGGFGPPPVIDPPDVPLRVVPASPGGLVVPGANVPIMSGQTGDDGAPRLAPTGQAPAIAALDQAAGLTPPPPPPQATVDGDGQPVAPAAQGGAQGTAATAPAATVPAPAAPAPVASAPTTAASAAAAASITAVQLAATPDEQGALSSWAKLQSQYPDLLGGRSPEIIPAIVGGKSVWRVRLDGFPNAAAATAFCASLTARGAACAVAAF